MAVLKKHSIERYLRDRFGPKATLLTYGVIGKDSSQGTYKQYGYGTPVKLTFQVGKKIQSAVLETMKPGPFGHEHMADRAQAMLWDYDSYGRLPRHVKGRMGAAIISIWNGWSKAEGCGSRIERARLPWRATWQRFMPENFATQTSIGVGSGSCSAMANASWD